VDVGQCAPGSVEISPATPTAPAECANCSQGNYCAGGQTPEVACGGSDWDDDLDPATPCVPKTTFAAGQYAQSAGNKTTDRTCAACASGQYSSTQNASVCQAWQICSPGRYVQTAGSSTSNRMCSACASGTFSTTQNASSCTSWSTCSAPSYYMSSAGSSTANRQCSACTPPEQTNQDNLTLCSVPSFQMSGGTVAFEAENYATTTSNGSSHTWSGTSVSGISGGTAIRVQPDTGATWYDGIAAPTAAPRLVYRVDFTTTGNFNVFIRGDDALGQDDGNSVWAGIDDVPISTTSYFSFPVSTGTWAWVSLSVNVSTTGIHTFTIWGREDGVKIDKIVITSGAAPSGNGPAESPYN
jgi:hypothetical protein